MSRTDAATHMGVFTSCQHGAASPLSAHAGTDLSMNPPSPSESCAVTLQSGRPVVGFSPTRPGMHLGLRSELINIAARSSAGARSSVQIGNTSPLPPNACTNSLVRTPGSAKLPSLAMHEWAITGHGQDAAPHDVSVVLGFFQVTVYGVGGPWIDDDDDLRRIRLERLDPVRGVRRRSAGSPPVSFDTQLGVA